MEKNGIYKLNELGIEFLKQNKCQIVDNINDSKLNTRPLYLALEDLNKKSVVYLIPMSVIRTQKQEEYYGKNMNSKDICSSFFEVGVVDEKNVVFKIASTFAVSDTMIEEWTRNKKIYVVRNSKLVKSIETKLNTMLVHYHANPEKSENHVIELRNILIEELSKNDKIQEDPSFKDKLSNAKDKADEYNKDLDSKNNTNNELDH